LGCNREHFATTAGCAAGANMAGRRRIVAQYGGVPARFHRLLTGCSLVRMKRLVAIVEDEPAIRENYAAAFTREGYAVRTYANRNEAMAAFGVRLPDLAVIDISLEDEPEGGFELCRQLRALSAELPIIFLTGHGDIPTTVRTIQAGAQDFLTKPVPKEQLLAAIERSLVRYREMQEQSRDTDALRSRLSQLTPREHDVFTLLVQGKPHKQIAYALTITERTVKMHRHNVMQKFGIQSLAELAAIAQRLGVLP
jgi:FixJ family two-component response regulator